MNISKDIPVLQKPGSRRHLKMDTERALSKLTKTTAASVNQNRGDQSIYSHKPSLNTRNKRATLSKLSDKFASHSALAHLTKP